MQNRADAFTDPGNIGDLALRISQDVVDPLRVALDDSSGVAIAPDAEAILARDLHQVGGFIEQAGELPVLHRSSSDCSGGLPQTRLSMAVGVFAARVRDVVAC